MTREGLRAAARSLRWPAIVVLVYAILRAIFDRVSRDGGLITPDGSVSFGVAALGALVLLLRILVLFVVPGVVAYRLVARALAPRPSPPR